MDERTYRKRLSLSIVACVSIVIICVGMLSGSVYRQHTIQGELEDAQAALSAVQQENENGKEQMSILESEKRAAQEEISSIVANESKTVTEKMSSTDISSTDKTTFESTSRPTKKQEEGTYPPPEPGDRKVYLTFDDGPSKNTPKILQILKEKNAKATFFVINNPKYNHYMKDIVSSGNAIALHSYSHDYKKIYSSDESFYNDLNAISEVVKKKQA